MSNMKMSIPSSTSGKKTTALLKFLRDAASLRRKRATTYGENDKVLWFHELPRDLPRGWKDACRSAFFADNPEHIADLWLEIRKKPKPAFPSLPPELRDWVSEDFQRQPDGYIDKEPAQLFDLLKRRITVVEQRRVAGEDAQSEFVSCAERVVVARRLEDYPGVMHAWREYLERQWKPWAEQMRWWRQVQEIYKTVDFMYRRLEEAEERYELVLAVGLLQWRDSSGVTVKRHLLTGAAEITLDASRGIFTVGPATSFAGFRVEPDMLELRDQPRLAGTGLESKLEELDAWDKTAVSEILRIIAYKASANAEVSDDWAPLSRADDTFRILYAPALVLRERRPTAFEELVGRFLGNFENGPKVPIPAPWNRLVSEGESVESAAEFADPADVISLDTRLYFPLPTNDEQRRIAECLRKRPYVLVKGPPGTGKSHTIANLICHLLATGERVLVTAQAAKALTVLRGLLPGDIANLCVTALGSSREDQRLLEESVRGILAQRNEWKGAEWALAEIGRLEEELGQLEGELAKVNRELRQLREAETHRQLLPGGYEGTAAQIAKQIEGKRQTYSWFPELADDQQRCPLGAEELEFLAEVDAGLTPARWNELSLEIGTFALPSPSEFEAAVEKWNEAQTAARAAQAGVSEERLRLLRTVPDASLQACRAFLTGLEEQATRARRTLGELTCEILKDLLEGRRSLWSRREGEVLEIVQRIKAARERSRGARVEIGCEVEHAKLLSDAERRLQHLKTGGWRGWGVLAPRVMRETRHIEASCRVDGKPPREPELLDVLCGYIEMLRGLESFCEVWPEACGGRPGDPRRAVEHVDELVEQFRQLMEFFRTADRKALEVVPPEEWTSLAEAQGRAAWRSLIAAEQARRVASCAKEKLDGWLEAIRGIPAARRHPCMEELASAVESRDPAQWRLAWEKREALRKEKERVERHEQLLGRLQQVCPQLAILIRSTQGDPGWANRLRDLLRAWDWAAARTWLRKMADPNRYAQLADRQHRLQSRIERKVEELARLRAWNAFFNRLDDVTEQNLIAWTKTLARIGKGAGRYASRHRRIARQYLMACTPKIPAWIMPLHKLWEMVEPTPGLFDTVIVDEASQAGIEALTLLLLAKRIVVVGDDKQNSPEGAGILEEDIARLAREYLEEFRFRNEFRPDSSLYDHAERAFGNLISLREHFRCVPEIIRFSNELCYTDAPLIPLRQPPPERLPPLKTQFVAQGSCEGDGARIINRAEAEAIVERIVACLNDPAYEGKTMGAIVLQGHAQAELIERRLAETLEPRVREERKLRCGVPATFQGDQRDVIFLSLVVAPNHHFRALTELEAQRRYNVAMSRARDQVWLFHSVQPHDLSRADLRYRLLRFFLVPQQAESERVYEELERLERATRSAYRQPGQQPDPYESWFEVDLALALLRRRYRLRPQVDVAGYRIDLVVEGPANRLAVECDGDAWHGPERFDRDLARQRQLERAGWKFVRIRESEFYADPKSAIERVIEACEDLGIRPAGEEEEVDMEEELAESDIEAEEEIDFSEGEEETVGVGRADEEPEVGTAYSEIGNFPDPRQASAANVRSALLRLIEQEGPLTMRRLLRLYVEGCPTIQRAGKTVRAHLAQILYRMAREGEIIVEDELRDRSAESRVLRRAGAPRVQERPAGGRDLLEIPPSELFLALDRLLASSRELAEDEEALARALLKHYGFSRLTHPRRRYLARIFKHYRGR